jgi:dienelactone hydrolase
VNGKGKSAGAADVERLVRTGRVVIAVDTRGTGELRNKDDDGDRLYYSYLGDYDNALRAFLAGKTLVGMRAADVSRALDLLAQRPEVDAARITGEGVGAGAVVLLHAAACDARLRGLTLDSMVSSYESVVTGRMHRDMYSSIVPGVLAHYDLPQLIAALKPRPVEVRNPVDPLGNRR